MHLCWATLGEKSWSLTIAKGGHDSAFTSHRLCIQMGTPPLGIPNDPYANFVLYIKITTFHWSIERQWTLLVIAQNNY